MIKTEYRKIFWYNQINYFYEFYKKYHSEELYNCLISSLSKYLNILNIKNTRIEYYEITFYIDNREYLLYYKEFDNSFIIFDKKKNKRFCNINDLFEYIENL